jgi:hypothetical protein
MKIVQTLWTKPSEQNNKTIFNRFTGGWNSTMNYYCALAYSCLSIKKFYPELELVTDYNGKELLIDKLKLPYSSYTIFPEFIDEIPSSLWALVKVYSYSIQQEPFLHIDNDVFLWGKFPSELMKQGLIVQNLETLTDIYDEALNYMHNHLNKLPHFIKKREQYEENSFQSINAGIFGGNDISFIKQYTDEVFKVFNDNLKKTKNLKKNGLFNIILEQMIFFQLANDRSLKISTLFVDDLINNMVNLVRFDKVSFENENFYIHCLGELKTNPQFNKQIEYRLYFEYPETYERIETILVTKNDLENDEDYKKFLHTHQILQSCNNIDDILNLTYTIDEKVVFKRRNNKYYIKDNNKFRELTGWGKYLLFFFKNKFTGHEIIKMIENSDIGKSFTKQEIEENICTLLTQGTILFNHLKII